MSAITAKEQGHNVTIIEKMKSMGKKLLITGKGRCNITNGADISDFIKQVPGNGNFLYSSFSNFTNQDVIQFFKKQGVEVKEERGKRIFPTSDKSQDVLNALTKKVQELKIPIKTSTKAEKILTENGEVKGIEIKTEEGKTEKILCEKVILATGGKSYSKTGSTGDGYELAKDLGHSIIPIRASLVPLECYEKETVKRLQGISLKNVAIKLLDEENTICEDFGEMLFTHFGVSGPIILSSSAHLLRLKNIDKKIKEKKISLFIDLKPALSYETLDLRIRRDFEEIKNKQFKNGLDKLLPKKLIEEIIGLSKIDPEKKINEVTKEERQILGHILKNMRFTISDFRPIEEAIITAGGINTKEINPKTMESKIIKGLHFAGEVIDVDAYTGGFNLQIAFSTGYTAGQML